MMKPVPMDDAGRSLVSAAVSKAEEQTAGEIVTILADHSDTYADIALAWSAAVALLALCMLASFSGFYLALWERLLGIWVQDWQPGQIFGLAAGAAAVKFGSMWLIQLYRPLRLWLVPPPIKHARVRARAVTCFKVGAERRTQGRTGVLIYLSLAERRAEIVADEAIASKVAPEVWGDALAALLSQIKAGHMAEGLALAAEKVGAVLAEHFPRAEDDVNELPDRLIEV
ncbi:MAG: hypothetical protein ABIW31_03200 [Novosphingobium sp.]